LKYLLDTHVLIWYVQGDSALPSAWAQILDDETQEVWASHASLWEIVIKIALGKLHLSLSLTELKSFLINHQFQILQMNFDHLETLRQMPFHHGDPFDRLIIAQAITEQMICLSVDKSFKHYSELRLISE